MSRHAPKLLASRDSAENASLQRISRKRSGWGVAQLTHEHRALYQLTDRLQRATSLEQVYDSALDTIMDALECQHASILLFDNEGVMRFVGSRRLSVSYRKAVEGHSPWKRDQKDLQIIHVDDIEKAGLPEPLTRTIIKEGIHALAFIPLVVNGMLIGKFMTYYDAPHCFSQPELELALTVGRQLAFGVEQKRTESALRQRTRSLEIINRVGNTLAGELNIEKLMQAVTDAGREVSGAEFGVFFCKTSDRGERSSLQAVSGLNPEALAGFQPEFPRTAVIRIADAQMHPKQGSYALRQNLHAGGRPIRSYLAVPVISRSGDMLGGLFFGHSSPGMFCEEVEALISAIASQAAIAIDNSNLYNALQQELTAHTEAEAEKNWAQANIARLAAIVETSDDSVIATNLDGIITSWNNGAERLFGYSAAEAEGESISILIPPDQREEEQRIFSQLRKGERIEHYETVRCRKDGTLVDVSLAVSPLRAADGTLIGASKIDRDITDRKRAVQALRASEEKFRNLADNISQLAWTASDHGEATWYNRRWYEFTGTTEEQMPGIGWQLVHPDHVERVRTKFQQCLQSGEEWEDTFPLRGKDGKYRWFLSRAVPIRDPNGRIQSWFGTNTDISELREAREALAKSNEDLEKRVAERTASLSEAMTQMQEFSYSVSHDLRAPIRIMQGYAQTVLDDYRQLLDARGIDYLSRIVRSGERMDRLVKDLLTYSRLARAEITLKPISLARLLKDIISHFPEMQPPRAQVAMEENLPAVLGHEPSLTQAFSNLLNNAVKFVAPGVMPLVQVYSERRGDRVRLWIQDNGIGIKPEHHGRLFGLFERFHSDKQYEGTGIGLAVVRKVVERMGGNVGLESNGTGSKFWIELSVAPESAPEPAPEAILPIPPILPIHHQA